MSKLRFKFTLSYTSAASAAGMAVADQPSEKFSELFEKMALPIVVISVLATIFLASFLSPLPNFSTDLSSFAPDTEYDDAKLTIYDELGKLFGKKAKLKPNISYIFLLLFRAALCSVHRSRVVWP